MNYAFCFVRRRTTFAAVVSQTERETRLCRRTTDRVPNTPRENYVFKMESTYFGRFIPVRRRAPATVCFSDRFFFHRRLTAPKSAFSPPRKTTNRQRSIRGRRTGDRRRSPSLSTPATDVRRRRFFRSETAFDLGKKKTKKWEVGR